MTTLKRLCSRLISVAASRNSYRMGLLVTSENGDFGAISVRVDFHCRVIFPCERGNVCLATWKRKRQRGSTLTFTCDLPYNVSILFTRVKFTYVRTEKLHGS